MFDRLFTDFSSSWEAGLRGPDRVTPLTRGQPHTGQPRAFSVLIEVCAVAHRLDPILVAETNSDRFT